MDAAAAANHQTLPQQKYDVFLSFRGEDTRLKFTSHLYAALKEKKIHAYMDDKSLNRGDQIGPALLTAIEQSKLSIVILSKHYVYSSWCLDELVHILKCKEEYRQIVIPVFYEIDPSDVRWQKGVCAYAFAGLEERYTDEMDKLRIWRDALMQISNLSGLDSQSPKYRHENELVQKIVDDVLMKLNRKVSCYAKGLIGMENHIHQLESLLCIHAHDICFRVVGIWGMGGCGKTTLADVVFHRNSSKFHSCVFLANVREETKKHGLKHLRNEFLRKLLEDQHISIESPSIGSSFVLDRLSRTKVLTVLDDVCDLSQLETLLGDQVQFGPGSRVIVTTRNRRLLKKMVHEDHIYKVDLLPYPNALQLFQSIAFEDDSSRENYSNFSKEVVDYAGCNPLALKVLGSSFLHCESKIALEEELKKLKSFPNKEIHNVLRLGYDGLGENEKGIFLHIACFLKGENIYDVERVLEMLGFSPLSGIGILVDMSLISIINERIEMHDLLQEMGRTIENGIEELGKRKRLWNAKESYEVLHNTSGASMVEGMYFDMSKIPELQLSNTAFKNTPKLKLLKFYVPPEVHEKCKCQRTEKTWSESGIQPRLLSWFPINSVVKAFWCFLAKARIWSSLSLLDRYDKVSNYDYEVFQEYCKLYFPEGLESLPGELRYLYWDGYPFKSLPSKYFPKNLVEIHMPYSQVKQLWSNDQSLWSLKHLNLMHSQQLEKIPNLSGSPNIEGIDLSGSRRLVEVPSYFQNLDNLTYLNLKYCKNLKIICGIPCNIKVLLLGCSGIEQIPPSIWSCEKLHTLDLGLCLYLNRKLLLKSFSVVGRLFSLRNLDLSWCRVSEIPDSLICLSTLEDLNLQGTMIESIPTSIKNVSRLVRLDLFACRKLRSLPELPSQLQHLDVCDCTSLKSVSSSRSALMQPWRQYRGSIKFARETFSFCFTNCCELDESSRNIIGDAQLRSMRMALLKHVGSLTVYYPGTEIPRWFDYQREGYEINIQFPHHDNLHTTTSSEEYSPCLGFSASIEGAELGFSREHGAVFRLVCDCNFKSNDGDGYQREFFSDWVYTLDLSLKENHVVMFLHQDVFWPQGNTEGNNPVPFNVKEASFRFYPEDGKHLGIEVKKCGIHLLHNSHDDIIDTT